MAKTQIYSGRVRTTNAAATNWRNTSIGQASVSTAGTAAKDAQQTVRATGTYSNLLFRLPSNSATSASTGSFIKDVTGPTAGLQNISFTAGQVNEQEDVTNADVVAAGNIINFRFINGGGGSNTEGLAGMCFSATVNTSSEYGSFNIIASATAGNTTYYKICSGANSATEDATLQLKMKSVGTFRYGCVGSLGANNHTAATSIGTRVNGITGSILVSIPNGVSGQVEDTTHSDPVPIDALVNNYTLTGTGAGGAGGGLLLYVFETTDFSQTSVVTTTSGGDPTFAAGAVAYLPLNGLLLSTITTESDCQTKSGVAMLVSLYQAFVSANGITPGNGTINLRKDAVNGAGSISVLASAFGAWIIDATNSDPLTVINEVDWQVTAGSGGTTMALSTVTSKQNMIITVPQVSFMNRPGGTGFVGYGINV